MARPRKRHVQQSFRYLDKNGQRRGADKHHRPGRPPKGPRSSERHKRREPLHASEPVHVTLRVADAVGRLRKRHLYLAIRRAMVTTFHRDNFRIVHLSIQSTHVHMLVEAHDRLALARGMQGFQISAARHINAAIGGKRGGERRRGCVFTDRYHAKILTSRRQTRHALAYVLNNWRRHGEDRLAAVRGCQIDPFSTAVSFNGWRGFATDEVDWPGAYQSLPTWQPKTWLLREGWKMYGAIDPAEIPGPFR